MGSAEDNDMTSDSEIPKEFFTFVFSNYHIKNE
jgi:hypothetical protein